MQLHGKNIIAGKTSGGAESFSGINPANGNKLTPGYPEASPAEIDQALKAASDAFVMFQQLSPAKMSAFLERIAAELLKVGDELVQRANLETALPEARLTGERARTVNQIKMFADLVKEGSWIQVRIDRAMPDRQPAPKPLLKRMMVPIGPVAVFGASNFPLAFSVAGGDTISALASGNPVIVKAHPAHPGTSEIAARAIQAAIEASGLPTGIFSLLHGKSNEVGLHLVRHPAVKAVAFTGSLQAGRALFDAAAARPEPIPVYAEMGSTNPLFVLPGAIKNDVENLAKGLLQSITMGVGQFCTKPGHAFGIKSPEWSALKEAVAKLASTSPPGTMLTPAIVDRFNHGVTRAKGVSGVQPLAEGGAQVLSTTARTFCQNDLLQEELFGPGILFIDCDSRDEMESLAAGLRGQLTATIHGTPDELAGEQGLVQILQQKAGRVIFNGFPTGVEVCPSMHHGGPYPATTAAHFTSVGTAAIFRFVRPVCFQGFPDAVLPAQLHDKNVYNILRSVDGKLTRDDLV